MVLMMRPRWWISLLCVCGLMHVGHQSSPDAQNGNWCFFKYYIKNIVLIKALNYHSQAFVCFCVIASASSWFPSKIFILPVAASCYQRKNGPVDISDGGVYDERASVSRTEGQTGNDICVFLSVQETPCRAWRLFVMQAGLWERRTRCLSACSTAGTTTARSQRMSSAPGWKPAPAPARYTVFCCPDGEECLHGGCVCVCCSLLPACLCLFLLLYPCSQRVKLIISQLQAKQQKLETIKPLWLDCAGSLQCGSSLCLSMDIQYLAYWFVNKCFSIHTVHLGNCRTCFSHLANQDN